MKFEVLIPPPAPLPDTPPCDAVYYKSGDPANKCRAKSYYRIGNGHYCQRHARDAALKYLIAESQEKG